MVDLTLDKDVAVLSLENGKANAFGLRQIESVIAGLERAKGAAEAVVLAGTPGVFSAGYDLKEVQKGEAAMAALLEAGGRMVLALLEHPTPVVAACTGHAIALGGLLLLACDSRVGAAGDFKIGLNETQIGIQLPVFGFELCAARISKPAQRNVVLEARLHDPETAQDIGFLDTVIAPDRVMDRAVETARRMGEYPRAIFARHKADLLRTQIGAIRDSLEKSK